MADDDQKTNGTEPPAATTPEAMAAELAALKKQIGTLINENKRVKDARDALGAKMKAWNDVEAEGLTPEQVKALASKQHETDLAKARETGEVDKLLANQRQKFERDSAELKAALEKEKRRNEELTVDATLDAELEKLKIKPALREAARLLHRPKITQVDDTDAPHGLRVVAQLGPDNYMTVGEYLKQWAENNDSAQEFLVPSQSSGGGAPGSSRRGAAMLGFKARKDLSAREKSDYINAHGIAAYQALPWSK